MRCSYFSVFMLKWCWSWMQCNAVNEWSKCLGCRD